MKYLGRSCLGLILICTLAFSAWAQTPEHPDGIGARFIFLDHFTPNIADKAEDQKITNGLEVSYTRNLGWKYLNVVLPAKLGVARFPGAAKDIRYASADLLLQGILFDPDKIISPYLFAGGGVVFENLAESNIQFPVGLGTHLRVTRDFYLNFQAEFRTSMATGKDNLQYGFGFMYVPGLGKKEPPLDTDGDGVPDMEDQCPLLAGPVEWQGCPDSDGDGLPDHKDLCPDQPGHLTAQGCPDRDGDGLVDSIDMCPDQFGSALLDGCPDRDGDGVPDQEDECPDEAGLSAYNGCPPPAPETPVLEDRDGDGIPDQEDQCPDVPGIADLGGCPPMEEAVPAPAPEEPPVPEVAEPAPPKPVVQEDLGDRDGDGVPDRSDRCPDTQGPASNEGCPIIAAEDRSVLDLAMRSIQFESGSATLMSDSYRTLDRIADIMLKYPDYHLIINGHTDNVGRSQTNLALSEQRARACYHYLVSRGVQTNRMIHSGFGDTKPLTSNRTEQGRSLNRRVEFIMFLR